MHRVALRPPRGICTRVVSPGEAGSAVMFPSRPAFRTKTGHCLATCRKAAGCTCSVGFAALNPHPYTCSTVSNMAPLTRCVHCTAHDSKPLALSDSLSHLTCEEVKSCRPSQHASKAPYTQPCPALVETQRNPRVVEREERWRSGVLACLRVAVPLYGGWGCV